MPIAAQNSGVEILGRAGVLKNRKFAMAANNKYLVTDGTYSGIGIVRDGSVVTAGTCPNAAAYLGLKDTTEELVSVFIGMLKK